MTSKKVIIFLNFLGDGGWEGEVYNDFIWTKQAFIPKQRSGLWIHHSEDYYL